MRASASGIAAALSVALALSSLAAPGARAGTRVLYEGGQGTLPSEQGLLFLSDPISQPKSRETLTSQGARLDSLALMKEKAGYFPRDAGHRLDRAKGYGLALELVLEKELNGTADRAGLSVILLSDDLKGIELGFWENEIWAQDDLPLFKHAEGASLDLASGAARAIEISVLGDGYRVRVDGALVLTGPLRDYRAFGFPYDLPNLYFLGDDTTSASARFELRRAFFSD